ncbi:hypothetical protein DMR_36950 [Solidesulfovibrio magneticus RS-1]|uniref:Uncharacterized protein n=1 Tax=Solidesulfovibrio magneticus (strain ATCC 700980 / DSM 13731 / RS-1) TaxID=573370 RepID=C4XM58_SOLM1|nr:hypothetical protein DMR_36950 [Solidesulfovibrio magneticus RS-1]
MVLCVPKKMLGESYQAKARDFNPQDGQIHYHITIPNCISSCLRLIFQSKIRDFTTKKMP